MYAEYYDDLSGAFTGWATGMELYDLTADVLQNNNVVWSAGQDRAKLHLSRVLNLLRGCNGTGCRQIFIDSDDGVTYMRDSDDAAGNTFTGGFTKIQTKIDEASAFAIHPEFDAEGRRVRMRQLAFIAGELWSRASSDTDGESWPPFARQELSAVWGGHAAHPPTTTACE